MSSDATAKECPSLLISVAGCIQHTTAEKCFLLISSKAPQTACALRVRSHLEHIRHHIQWSFQITWTPKPHVPAEPIRPHAKDGSWERDNWIESKKGKRD